MAEAGASVTDEQYLVSLLMTVVDLKNVYIFIQKDSVGEKVFK